MIKYSFIHKFMILSDWKKMHKQKIRENFINFI